MSRNLILSGGIFHPFEVTSDIVAGVLAEAGMDSEIVSVSAGMRRLAAGERFDLLTFNCLSWSMVQHAKYEPHRAEFARKTTARERQAIEGHVAAGRGLLGLHTAAICFDDWPGWGDLLGVRWVWGQSGHPEPGPLEVRVTDPDSALTRGLDGFGVEDELYGGMELAPDARVLAEARLAEGGDARPVLLTREAGGRVVFDALGHDERSFAVPAHRDILRRAAAWLTQEKKTA